MSGFVRSGWESVQDAFQQNVLEDREGNGSQVCVFHKGECVVNLAGGSSSSTSSIPPTKTPTSSTPSSSTTSPSLTASAGVDTTSLLALFSSSKILESLCIAMLEDRNLLSYDEPISKYWPEFGDKISTSITVGELMRHQSGLSGIHESLVFSSTKEWMDTFSDPLLLEEWLLRNKLEWGATASSESAESSSMMPSPPRAAYNAVTRGLYASCLLRHVDPMKRTMNQFFQDEIARPLSVSNDVMMVLRPEYAHRVACHDASSSFCFTILKFLMHVILPEKFCQYLYGEFDTLYPYEVKAGWAFATSKMRRRTVRISKDQHLNLQGSANDLRLLSVLMPSSSGVATAKALAKIFSALACGGTDRNNGVRLLSQKGLKNATRERRKDGGGDDGGDDGGRGCFDEILFRKVRIASCGWGLDRFEFVGFPHWIGWCGVGGSVCLFNLQTETSFVYLPSRLDVRVYKPRGLRLLKAVQDLVEKMR